MATVYRIERPDDGIGPYNHIGEELSDRLASAHAWDLERHPAIGLDLDYRMEPGDRCGFANMRQLFSWFGGWLPILLRNGYRIVVYRDAYVMAQSDHQLVFQP